MLLGGGAVVAVSLLARAFRTHAQSTIPARSVAVTQFGATTEAAADNTQAIQAAIHEVEKSGGGTVLIPGRFRCGQFTISGSNVRLAGQEGWLVDARLIIGPDASNIEVSDLGLIDTTGTGSYLADISGRNCRFNNLQLVKDPPAKGYQMYVRQPSQGCHFEGLQLRGSNGIFLAGSDHSFDGFDFECRRLAGQGGGDDAFAIKAAGATTQNITIRNGTIRGFAAMVAIGSEVGSKGGEGDPGVVRNIVVENVSGERCTRLAFLKPDALRTDWRDGVVEGIQLRNLALHDSQGQYFLTGIQIVAARGAAIRDIQASGIEIVARARDKGVAPTAAIEIVLLDEGAPATIEDVHLQVNFADPFSGAANSQDAPGYPVDYIVHIERRKGAPGSMSGITLDVDGIGSSRGGIYVGDGLDDAVDVDKAVLKRVAMDPPGKRGGGGIWSNSRVKLGDVQIDSPKLPKLGGTAFDRSADKSVQ